jgi:hypothetical protein
VFSLDSVRGEKPRTKRDLIFRWLPLHVENLLARPQKLFGTTMALKTPFHCQGCCLKG